MRRIRAYFDALAASRNIDLLWLMLGFTAMFFMFRDGLPIRTAGDEKVYIAQALEMAHHHTWFKQTLFNEPNYYKGPLFYQLLRLGFLVFGEQAPVSIIYMNLLGIAVSCVCCWYFVRNLWPRDLAAAYVVPFMLMCSAGAYAHALAAQMESLLISCYGIFLALIGLGSLVAQEEPKAKQRLFYLHLGAWITAGLAGLLKSPLHAVLLGVSALAYWLTTGQLRRLASQGLQWFALTVGMLVCIGGYLPMLLFDKAAFWTSYVERETLSKGNNNESVGDFLWPFLSSHLFPWLPLFVWAIWMLVRKSRELPASQPIGAKRGCSAVLLALSVIVPTAGFFIIHPYRNGVYMLPILPGVALLTAAGFHKSLVATEDEPWVSLRVALGLIALPAMILSLALLACVWHFAPWPAWWGKGTSGVLTVSLVASSLAFAMTLLLHSRLALVRCLFIAAVCFYSGGGLLMNALSRHEVYDLQTEVNSATQPEWFRLNFNQHIWSETGLLNFMLGRPVSGITSLQELATYLEPHHIFLIPDQEQVSILQKAVATHPELTLAVRPWRRWRLHGAADDGTPLWLRAWRTRSMEVLEKAEFIATLERAPAIVSGHDSAQQTH